MVENKDFVFCRCPICHHGTDGGLGWMIKAEELRRLKPFGFDDGLMGLLECIRRFDATMNCNLRLPEHIALLNKFLSSKEMIFDFTKYLENG